MNRILYPILFIIPLLLCGCVTSSNLSRSTVSSDTVSIQKYIAEGGNINSEDYYYFGGFFETKGGTVTPLIYSSIMGRVDVTKFLLEKSANVNYQERTFGMNALMYTLWKFNGKGKMNETVNLLLEKDININARDKNGSTALMIAAYKGDTSIMTELIQRGASISIINDKGWTALTCSVLGSVERNNYDAVKLLLNHGAQSTIKSTPIIYPVNIYISADSIYADTKCYYYELSQIISDFQSPVGNICLLPPGIHKLNVSYSTTDMVGTTTGSRIQIPYNFEKGHIYYVKYSKSYSAWTAWIEKIL
jgi:ankyrin repeat protein